MMRRLILGLSFVLTVALAAAAQAPAQGTTPGAAHSNAPAGTPAASNDRDKGTARAADVGKGKKKGLKHRRHKKNTAANTTNNVPATKK